LYRCDSCGDVADEVPAEVRIKTRTAHLCENCPNIFQESYLVN